MEDIIKRKGRIFISRESIRSGVENGFLKELYSFFYPVSIEERLEVSLWDDKVLYGYSKKFRELEDGEVVPLYVLTVFMNDDGTVKITSVEEDK